MMPKPKPLWQKWRI